MAKKEIDSFVAALISIKPMISTLKTITDVIAFDPEYNLIYMKPQGKIHDMVVEITDPDMINGASKFTYHLINTVEAVSFNKALKKTKTVSEIKDDKSIQFSTDGYEETLTMIPIDDYNIITKSYQKIFKDKDLTKTLIDFITNSNKYNVLEIGNETFESLKKGKLIKVSSSSGNELLLTKNIFGNIKKTIKIEHSVIEECADSEVVVFKQYEDGYNIYHIIRFLKW